MWSAAGYVKVQEYRRFNSRDDGPLSPKSIKRSTRNRVKRSMKNDEARSCQATDRVIMVGLAEEIEETHACKSK